MKDIFVKVVEWMSDLISREEAIGVLETMTEIEEGIEMMYALPTIEAEPVVHGNWGEPFKIDAKHIGYKCSKCGCYGVPGWNYCPNCGANMKGEKQNETRGIQNSL